MLTAAAAKRHISLCGCVLNFILAVSLFDRQYNLDIESGVRIKWKVQIATLVHIMYMTRTTQVIIARRIWMRTMQCA